jgi:hypothetical protein
LGDSQQSAHQLRIVTCYIVNASRTKLLLRYDGWSKQWIPTDCPLKMGVAVKPAIRRFVLGATGMTARHLVWYQHDEAPLSAAILEASDTTIPHGKLRLEYQAAWLRRSDILALDQAHASVKAYAELLLPA